MVREVVERKFMTKQNMRSMQTFSKKYPEYIPKKGRRKAMTSVENTRVALNSIEHQVLLASAWGSSSSKLLANGFINNGYLFPVKLISIAQRKAKSHEENFCQKDIWWTDWSPDRKHMRTMLKNKEK